LCVLSCHIVVKPAIVGVRVVGLSLVSCTVIISIRCNLASRARSYILFDSVFMLIWRTLRVFRLFPQFFCLELWFVLV
jgi:hypothetical protein